MGRRDAGEADFGDGVALGVDLEDEGRVAGLGVVVDDDGGEGDDVGLVALGAVELGDVAAVEVEEVLGLLAEEGRRRGEGELELPEERRLGRTRVRRRPTL